MDTPFILGTAQLGCDYGINNSVVDYSDDHAFDVLEAAWSEGIRLLDTAEAYPNSQEMIGRFIERYPSMEFKICTKLAKLDGSLEAKPAQEIVTHIQDDLCKLRIKKLYSYSLHSFEMCRNAQVMDSLLACKGVHFEKLGVSIYEPWELEYIVAHAELGVDMVQLPFNLWNCSQWLRDNLIERAAGSGITLVARSVFAQGLVFMDPDSSFPRSINMQRSLREFRRFAERRQLNVAEVAAGFVSSFDSIACCTYGCETAQQVRENATMVRAAKGSWSSEEIASQTLASAELDQSKLDPRNW